MTANDAYARRASERAYLRGLLHNLPLSPARARAVDVPGPLKHAETGADRNRMTISEQCNFFFPLASPPLGTQAGSTHHAPRPHI